MLSSETTTDSGSVRADSRLQEFGLQAAIATAMTLLMTMAWCLMHRYQGFSHDAQVYAVQALARLEPGLAADLFFQHVSQDQFTVFSGFYAGCIRTFGLIDAAKGLTILFTVWFYVAAWFLARNLFNRDAAWLALLAPLVTIGAYGAYDVFQYSASFLSARLPAEALVITALAYHVGGWRKFALLCAAAALFVHPLIAFPGMLVLLSLWVPVSVTLRGALMGCLCTLLLALLAVANPGAAHWIRVMDPEWTGIVVERSEFLFPQHWRSADWIMNLRGFLCLGVTATAIADRRVRQLALVAGIIGVAGMVVACIGGMIGPIALLLQGQAWRWEWLSTFLSILLLIPTVFTVWRDERCGNCCAILLLSAWTFSAIDGTACAALALAIWLARGGLSDTSARALRWGALALGAVIAIWAIGHLWPMMTMIFDSGREARLAQWGRNVSGFQLPLILVVIASWYALKHRRSPLAPALAALVFGAAAAALVPSAFKDPDNLRAETKNGTFADWQTKIPARSSVFILREDDTGTFAWLTLHRVNYLSLDQSAGAVFSRETALEVKRRSEVLAPVKDADWKIHSLITWYENNKGKKPPPRIRPLTAENLQGLCRDPALGFVIAHEYVGFDAVRHPQKGPWQDWNLYDCNVVRARGSSA